MDAAPDEAFGHPLRLQRPGLCPEIALWLIAGEVDLELACRDLDSCHPPPYWAFCWGAGQSLARFVLDHAEIVRDRAVVDIGAGCGIVAIAAALAGAARVCAVDIDPAARGACLRNATANAVTLSITAELPRDFDILLAADVLYEPGMRDRLHEARASGHAVFIADPERAGSPDLGLPALVRHAARTLPDVDSPTCGAAIFVLP
jgi:predicted nicotinamide N-methyase